MSWLPTLIGFKLINGHKPGGLVVILALVYIGYLVHTSIVGTIAYIIFLLIFFLLWIIMPRMADDKLEKEVLAERAARRQKIDQMFADQEKERLRQARIQKKKNPYA